MSEGLSCQASTTLPVQAAGLQRSDDPGVLMRRGDRSNVLMVLGSGPKEGHPADVDLFDPRLVRELIEVAGHQLEGPDAEPLKVFLMDRIVGIGKNASMDLWVKRLDPPAEHLGKAGHIFRVGHLHSRLPDSAGGAPGRDNLRAQTRQLAGKLDDAGLVRDRQNGPLHLEDTHLRWDPVRRPAGIGITKLVKDTMCREGSQAGTVNRPGNN